MEFKFNSFNEKSAFYAIVKADNNNFTDEMKICESRKKSIHLDFYLEVFPTVFPDKRRSVICLVCTLDKTGYKIRSYNSFREVTLI